VSELEEFGYSKFWLNISSSVCVQITYYPYLLFYLYFKEGARDRGRFEKLGSRIFSDPRAAGPFLEPRAICRTFIFKGTVSGSLLSYTLHWLKLANQFIPTLALLRDSMGTRNWLFDEVNPKLILGIVTCLKPSSLKIHTLSRPIRS
jgi:hypothetical protein